MLEKIIKTLFILLIGSLWLLLFIIDLATSIVEFKWWSFLVVPGGFILCVIGLIGSMILSEWIIYAIRNRTFHGFLKSIQKKEYASSIDGYWVEFCNACEKEYNPKTSGGTVNGHPFCTECLEKMGEGSARLEVENEQLKEAIITLHIDLFDSCPTGNLTPEQSAFVQNVGRWQEKICAVIDWRDMPK
jgi:hypothetical protein